MSSENNNFLLHHRSPTVARSSTMSASTEDPIASEGPPPQAISTNSLSNTSAQHKNGPNIEIERRACVVSLSVSRGECVNIGVDPSSSSKGEAQISVASAEAKASKKSPKTPKVGTKKADSCKKADASKKSSKKAEPAKSSSTKAEPRKKTEVKKTESSKKTPEKTEPKKTAGGPKKTSSKENARKKKASSSKTSEAAAPSPPMEEVESGLSGLLQAEFPMEVDEGESGLSGVLEAEFPMEVDEGDRTPGVFDAEFPMEVDEPDTTSGEDLVEESQVLLGKVSVTTDDPGFSQDEREVLSLEEPFSSLPAPAPKMGEDDLVAVPSSPKSPAKKTSEPKSATCSPGKLCKKIASASKTASSTRSSTTPKTRKTPLTVFPKKTDAEKKDAALLRQFAQAAKTNLCRVCGTGFCDPAKLGASGAKGVVPGTAGQVQCSGVYLEISTKADEGRRRFRLHQTCQVIGLQNNLRLVWDEKQDNSKKIKTAVRVEGWGASSTTTKNVGGGCPQSEASAPATKVPTAPPPVLLEGEQAAEQSEQPELVGEAQAEELDLEVMLADAIRERAERAESHVGDAPKEEAMLEMGVVPSAAGETDKSSDGCPFCRVVAEEGEDEEMIAEQQVVRSVVAPVEIIIDEAQSLQDSDVATMCRAVNGFSYYHAEMQATVAGDNNLFHVPCGDFLFRKVDIETAEGQASAEGGPSSEGTTTETGSGGTNAGVVEATDTTSPPVEVPSSTKTTPASSTALVRVATQQIVRVGSKKPGPMAFPVFLRRIYADQLGSPDTDRELDALARVASRVKGYGAVLVENLDLNHNLDLALLSEPARVWRTLCRLLLANNLPPAARQLAPQRSGPALLAGSLGILLSSSPERSGFILAGVAAALTALPNLKPRTIPDLHHLTRDYRDEVQYGSNLRGLRGGSSMGGGLGATQARYRYPGAKGEATFLLCPKFWTKFRDAYLAHERRQFRLTKHENYSPENSLVRSGEKIPGDLRTESEKVQSDANSILGLDVVATRYEFLGGGGNGQVESSFSDVEEQGRTA